jgi:hypothetical protein
MCSYPDLPSLVYCARVCYVILISAHLFFVAAGQREAESAAFSSAPPGGEGARRPWKSRRGVVTYDDSPQQPDKPPTFPATAAHGRIDAQAVLAVWADGSHQNQARPEANDSPDVPFLPAPKTRIEDAQGCTPTLISAPLETPSTLAVSPARDPVASSSTESHFRAKAARVVAERGMHPAGPSSAQPGSAQRAGGIGATPTPTRHDAGGIVAPSPEQELHSKRSVEDVLSRLEGRTPDYANGKAEQKEAAVEVVLPVTQFSARSTPGARKTPITQFSSRGARAPATGFGSLYSPRQRHLTIRDANALEIAPGTGLGKTTQLKGESAASSSLAQSSGRRSTTSSTPLVPPSADDDGEEGLEHWVGSRPPSVISVASVASSTDAKIVAKRRELRHALSSDEGENDSGEEMSPSHTALANTGETGWESASDYQFHGSKLPPSGIRRMAVRMQRGAPAQMQAKGGRISADGKHHHREASRRANGVSQAMRREWASQILGELKGRFDYMHRGQRPFFSEWKFSTEISNVHYHLLALKIRRNDRAMLKTYIQTWHAGAHTEVRDRRLCLRGERRFRSRLYKAYMHNWRLYTCRIKRHSGILYRALWREASYFFKVWAKDVAELLWMRDRLWQLRQRRCRRALSLCFTGMRDVIKSRQHMQLFSGVLCRDLLTETVVCLHAWRDYVKQIDFLHMRGRRCELRWRMFERYSCFHAWWSAMVDEKDRRAKVRRADVHMAETLLLKFHCGWLQAIDRMRYLAHAGASIFERHERLILKGAFAELNFIFVSNDSLRKVKELRPRLQHLVPSHALCADWSFSSRLSHRSWKGISTGSSLACSAHGLL